MLGGFLFAKKEPALRDEARKLFFLNSSMEWCRSASRKKEWVQVYGGDCPE
jgi:hypothetical protein